MSDSYLRRYLTVCCLATDHGRLYHFCQKNRIILSLKIVSKNLNELIKIFQFTFSFLRAAFKKKGGKNMYF